MSEIEKTLSWIKSLELPDGGITAGPGLAAYPEVSGYLIPTFYDYGETAIAERLAEYLLTVQNEDGSFPDMKGKARTFDTGACMEGLGRAFQETSNPYYQDGATRAWDWLESMELESGALRVSPGSDKTHVYTMRVSGLMGNEKATRYWKEKAWDVTRVHYAAYALEGLWEIGENGFVIANLLLARKAITKDKLIPMTAGASWVSCEGSDTCATAQMAILYWQAGMQEDARRLAEGVGPMVGEDGGVRLGRAHAECNSWTAKWALDMWKVMG